MLCDVRSRVRASSSVSLSLSPPAAPVPSLFSLPRLLFILRPVVRYLPPPLLFFFLSLFFSRRRQRRVPCAFACVSSAARGNRGSLPGVCASMLSGALRRIRVQATWRKVRWCYDSGFQARRVLRDDSSAVAVSGTSVSAPIVCCYSFATSSSTSLPVVSSASSSFSITSSAASSSSFLSSSSSASSSFLDDYDNDDDSNGGGSDSNSNDESKRRFPRLCSDRRSRRRGAYR